MSRDVPFYFFREATPFFRQAQASGFSFDVPSGSGESHALFCYFTVFGRQFWDHGGEEDTPKVIAARAYGALSRTALSALFGAASSEPTHCSSSRC
jgi:hypothetical protein